MGRAAAPFFASRARGLFRSNHCPAIHLRIPPLRRAFQSDEFSPVKAGLLSLCQWLTRHALGSGLAALFYLALHLFAASPELHHLLHDDSHLPDHQCAISLLSKGQVDVESAGFNLSIPETLFVLAPRPSSVPVFQVEVQLPPGRAPPIFPS